MPDKFLYWVLPAVWLGFRVIRRHRPELIFSSSGPPASAIVGSLLQRLSGLPWVAEFRDLWSDNPYDVRIPAITRLDTWLEAKTLKVAKALVTVSRPLAEHLQRLHDKPVHVIYNGFDETDYPTSVIPDTKFTVTYTGMIYPGKRDPIPLFQALKLLESRGEISPEMFKVSFYGPQLEETVEPLAHRYGVHPYCEFSASIPYWDCLYRQRQANVLLLLEWNDPRAEGTITGKVFEYLGAGRPILVLGYPEGALAKIVRDTGMGVVLNEPPAIAAYISQAVQRWQRGEGSEPVAASGSTLHKYSRRAAAQQMAQLFSSILS